MAEPLLDGAGVMVAWARAKPQACHDAGWIGKDMPAAIPITASYFLKPAALIGVRRSVVKT